MIMNTTGLREGLKHLLDEAYTRGAKDAKALTFTKGFADQRKAAVEAMLKEVFERAE